MARITNPRQPGECSKILLDIIGKYRRKYKQKQEMKRRPLSVIIVAILFIIAGCVGFVYHANEYFEQRSMNYELIWVLLLQVLAVVCGLLLLRRVNWARWVAIAWLAYHVSISIFHSASEIITHSVLLIVVTVLLFIPKSSVYFKGEGKPSKK